MDEEVEENKNQIDYPHAAHKKELLLIIIWTRHYIDKVNSDEKVNDGLDRY